MWARTSGLDRRIKPGEYRFDGPVRIDGVLTTLTSGIELFNHRLRIQNLFDWRGGNRYYNNTERIRCTRPNCNGLFNPNASFEEQAMGESGLRLAGNSVFRARDLAGVPSPRFVFLSACESGRVRR